MEFHRMFFLLLVARYVSAEPGLFFMSTMCDETLTVDAFGGRMDSQTSIDYSANYDCSLTIIAPQGLQLVFTVDRVDIEGGSACPDSLDVYDGLTKVNRLAQICGYSTVGIPDIVSTAGALTLHFTSDASVQDSGFYVSFNPFKPVPCDSVGNYTFQCDNDRCIQKALNDDLYDNCGDNSDESFTSSDDFDDDIGDVIGNIFRLGIGVLVAIIVGCIVAAVLLCVCCGCLCYHCCCKSRRQPQQVVTTTQPGMVMQPAAYPPQQPGGYPPQQPGGYPPQQPGIYTPVPTTYPVDPAPSNDVKA